MVNIGQLCLSVLFVLSMASSGKSAELEVLERTYEDAKQTSVQASKAVAELCSRVETVRQLTVSVDTAVEEACMAEIKKIVRTKKANGLSRREIMPIVSPLIIECREKAQRASTEELLEAQEQCIAALENHKLATKARLAAGNAYILENEERIRYIGAIVNIGGRANLSSLERELLSAEVTKNITCMESGYLGSEFEMLEASGISGEALKTFRGEHLSKAMRCDELGNKVEDLEDEISIAAHNYLIELLEKWMLQELQNEKTYIEKSEYIQNFLYIMAFEKRNLELLNFLLEQKYRPVGFCEDGYLKKVNYRCYVWDIQLNFGGNFDDAIGYWNDGARLFTQKYNRGWYEEDLRRYEIAKLNFERDTGALIKPSSIFRNPKTAEEKIEVYRCKVAEIRRLGRYHLYAPFVKDLFPTTMDDYVGKAYRLGLDEVENRVAQSTTYFYDNVYLTRNRANHALDGFSNSVNRSANEEANGITRRQEIVWGDAKHLSSICGN